MSVWSKVFKSVSKSAKKAGGEIADMGSNVFSKNIRSVKNTIKEVSTSKATSNVVKNINPSTMTGAVTKNAGSLIPPSAGVKGVSGALAVAKKRLITGAGVGGLVGLAGLGGGFAIRSVKDEFDPVKRENRNESDAINNYKKYLENLQTEQDIINAGKESGSIDPNYFAGSDGSLLSGDPVVDSSRKNNALIFLGLGAAAVGGYFLLRKKKGKSKK